MKVRTLVLALSALAVSLPSMAADFVPYISDLKLTHESRAGGSSPELVIEFKVLAGGSCYAFQPKIVPGAAEGSSLTIEGSEVEGACTRPVIAHASVTLRVPNADVAAPGPIRVTNPFYAQSITK